MMAKIVKGAGFKGTVNYILDPKKGTTLLDVAGVRLKSKASIIQSFIAQAKLKPSLGRMKITNTQYILVRHFDKEHPHVHLCFNSVDNNESIF